MDIKITNQEEFNNLGNLIIDNISTTDNIINIELSEGTFYFKNNNVLLDSLTNVNLDINIIGNNTVIRSNGHYLDAYAEAETITPFTALYDESDPITEEKEKKTFWTVLFGWLINMFKKKKKTQTKVEGLQFWNNEFLTTDSIIEVIDEETKKCCLTCKETFDKTVTDSTYIQVLQWFKSNWYKVESIDDNKIYFICSDLVYNKSKNTWSINADYNFSNSILPRFRLSNNNFSVAHSTVTYPYGYNKVFACTETNFLTISNCKFKSLNISNIVFDGNSSVYNDNLITFSRSTFGSNVNINNCEFKNLFTRTIYALRTNKITIDNNKFNNLWLSGSHTEASNNIVVSNNYFNKISQGNTNQFAVRIDGENFKVSDNEFTDYGYGAIEAGTWYAAYKAWNNTGNIQYNYLHDSYTSLMDSGAIYLLTDNDTVNVRYNYINNYTGVYANRGIFCDDGARNFNIYDNIVINTPNSYSIDARRVVSIEAGTYPNSHVDKANINNMMRNNIIDNALRFEGRDAEGSNCICKTNYRTTDDITLEDSIYNVTIEEPLFNTITLTIKDGKIVDSDEIPAEIKTGLKKYII